MYVVIEGFENVLCSGLFGGVKLYKRLCVCNQKELETLYKCNIKGIKYEEATQPKTDEEATDE